jgi:hypothetical protein
MRVDRSGVCDRAPRLRTTPTVRVVVGPDLSTVVGFNLEGVDWSEPIGIRLCGWVWSGAWGTVHWYPGESGREWHVEGS